MHSRNDICSEPWRSLPRVAYVTKEGTILLDAVAGNRFPTPIPYLFSVVLPTIVDRPRRADRTINSDYHGRKRLYNVYDTPQWTPVGEVSIRRPL